MKNKQSILKIAAAIMTATLLATGCAGNEKNDQSTSSANIESNLTESKETATGWKVGDKIGDNVSLDWYINIGWWEYTNKWVSYPLPKEITDITGVTPNIIIPTGDGTEKVNLMMATDTLPDLVSLGLTDPLVGKMISQDYVYPVDDLMKEHAPSFLEEIQKEIVWDYSKIEDGHVYGFPSFFVKDKSKLGSATFNVKKDYYAELGSPDMSTPDSFIAALKSFKAKYPTINGKDSIPLTVGTGWYRFMLENPFGVADYYIADDGVVSMRYKDPKYVDVAKFYNELYREKLLDPEIFIKQDTQLNEDLASGRVFCYPTNYWDLDAANSSLDQQKADTHFVAIEPLKAVENVTFPGVGRLGWTTTMISKKSKQVEAATRFSSYMFSKEGNLLLTYGHEGTDYTIDGDKITRSTSVAEEMSKDPAAFNAKTGMNTFRLFTYPYYTDVPVVKPTDDQQNRLDLAAKYVRDNTKYTYHMSPDPTSAEGIVLTKLDEIVGKTWPKMVMAPSEDEAVKLLNSMVVNLESAGLPTLEKYWTEQYKKNVAQFE